jgi:hypothetical protein
MRHGLLGDASLQQMLCDTLDHSDDIVIVPEQTGSGGVDIVIVAASDAF